MRNLRAPINFFVAVLLVFSSLLAFSASASAVTPTPKELWHQDFDGDSLFEPQMNKDGNLIVGRYSVVNEVYENDYMTIDKSSGTVLKHWKQKGPSGAFTDENGNVYIYVVDTNTSQFTLYNENGGQLWSKNFNVPGEYLFAEYHNGKIIIYDNYNETATEYTKNGQKLGNVPYDDGFGENPYDIKENEEETQLSLVKYDQDGETTFEEPLNVAVPENSYLNGQEVSTSASGKLFILLSFYNYDEDSYLNQVLIFDPQSKQTVQTDLPAYNGWYEVLLVNNKLHLFGNGTYIVVNENGQISQTKIYNDDEHFGPDVQQIDDQNLYLLFSDKAVLADLDGNVKWTKDLKSDHEYDSWYLYKALKNLYVVSDYNSVASQDKTTGNINWQYQLDTNGYLYGFYVDEANGKIYYQMTKWTDDNNPQKITTIGALSFGEDQPTAVAANKTWNINFSIPVNGDSVNNQTVYVLDANGTKVDGVTYEVQGSTVKVLAPENGYAKGQYKLIVDKVKSLSQKTLKIKTEKKFSVE